MSWFRAASIFFVACWLYAVHAQPSQMPLIGVGGAPSGAANSVAYTNWVTAVTGAGQSLNGTHDAAYKAMLNGMTTDGLFNMDGTTSFFDFFFIFATQNSTIALLNIITTGSNASNASGLTFTTDRGYTGNGTTSNFIDSNFNPSTAGSPKYTQNAAHMSAWNLSAISDNNPIISRSGQGPGEIIYPKFASDGNMYMRINDNPESSGFGSITQTGHLLGNRSSSTARQGYQNASSIGTFGSVNSQAVISNDLVMLADGNGGSVYQIAMGSAGGSLSGANVTSFYNRLRTYMTAVGVP